MKKVVLFTVICFVFSLLALTSCKKDVEEASPKLKQIKLDNVKVLCITNPTDKKQNAGETWVSIDYEMERNAELNLPVFTQNEAVNCNSERAISTSKRPTTYKVGEQKDITDVLHSVNDTAKMVYEGVYCYIWTYNNEPLDSALSEDEIENFAKAFDDIYEKQIALCGPKYAGETVYTDVINPDKKISLMLCDIGRDRASGDVYGYFAPSNYSSYNKMEIIFVDSYFAKRPQNLPDLLSTVSHEFNHLLNYCNKDLKYGLSQKSWYTEMLSMLCQDFFDEELGLDEEHGVKQRLYKVFVTGSYTQGFGNWNQNSPFVGSYYANAYAFGAFLARNYGGAKLVHEIMTNEYVNEESVVHAVNKINGTNLTFSDLLKEFPLILLNNKNQSSDMPSLFKSVEEELPGLADYTYKLKEIDLCDISDGSISVNNPDIASDVVLDSYGFEFYYFTAPAKVTLSIKDFLNHRIVSY